MAGWPVSGQRGAAGCRLKAAAADRRGMELLRSIPIRCLLVAAVLQCSVVVRRLQGIARRLPATGDKAARVSASASRYRG
jgi:hypothetical protein